MEISKTLYIKYMVCKCCIRILRQELSQQGISIQRIVLGEIDIKFDDTKITAAQIDKIINDNGFEQILNKDKILVQQIKTAVIELIHYANNMNSIIRNSDYLVEKLGYSYQHLSTLYSKYETNTLEKFIILHKIEKVKEMIEYGDLTFSGIAFAMGYSSVQYLSTQFKNITGISVTDYKKTPNAERKSIAEI